MALLHESLYQSDNLSEINFPEYILQLADHLFRSYGVTQDRIRLRTELDHFALHLDAAVPCGLIINELLSNSLKYAFPDGRTGEIHIGLHGLNGSAARLIIGDNGVGLKSGVDWTTTRSLGLRLVRSLTQQLGATIEVRSEMGMEVELEFPAAT
jgi:two-component sensor histidine kinase